MNCPVCWGRVTTNAGGVYIDKHRDKAGNFPCPGTGSKPMEEGLCRTAG